MPGQGAGSGCWVRVPGQVFRFYFFNLDSGTGVPGQGYYKLTNNNMIFNF